MVRKYIFKHHQTGQQDNQKSSSLRAVFESLRAPALGLVLRPALGKPECDILEHVRYASGGWEYGIRFSK